MALATNTQVKDYLGISGATDDTLITTLITRAQAMMERYCNRVFESASYTEDHSGGSSTIQLKNTPVTAVASVSSLDASGNATALPSTGYRFDGDTGILSVTSGDDDYYFTDRAVGSSALTSPSFPCGFRNIRVAYTGGYSSIPTDLVQVCIELTANLYQNRRTNPSMAQENIGGGQSFTVKGADDMVRWYGFRLDPFKRYAI